MQCLKSTTHDQRPDVRNVLVIVLDEVEAAALQNLHRFRVIPKELSMYAVNKLS